MEQHDIFLDDVKVSYDLEAMREKLRIQSNQTAVLKRLAKLLKEAEAVARPKAVVRLCELELLDGDQVRVGGTVFRSTLLCDKLKERGRAFPYVATEGVELAEWSRALTSSLDLMCIGAIREAAVKQCKDRLETKLLEQFGMDQVSYMQPGSLEVWPITEQTALFEVMKPWPEKIGLTLRPSLMMDPEFSVSGIFFQTETKFYNCQLCPRESCPNRKTPYTGVA